jgi:hypothetical protein
MTELLRTVTKNLYNFFSRSMNDIIFITDMDNYETNNSTKFDEIISSITRVID